MLDELLNLKKMTENDRHIKKKKKSKIININK
jgi:hypothetical protein